MTGQAEPDVRVEPVSPASPQAGALIQALDRLQSRLYPAGSNHLEPANRLQGNDWVFLGARCEGGLVGCGAVGLKGDYGELKRMFVHPRFRCRGVGRALLNALEAELVARGVLLARLETGVRQPEALAFYRRHGYRDIPPFGGYGSDPLSVFMEKSLVCPDRRERP